MSDQCLFCGIVAGDIPSVKVAEDESTYAFMDINPGSDGHALVIPKRHAKDLMAIEPEDLAACSRMAQRVAKAMTTELQAEGVNLLNCCGEQAWQTVFHFHFHVLPRYSEPQKDRLSLPWVPTPGDRATITDAGERLAAALA